MADDQPSIRSILERMEEKLDSAATNAALAKQAAELLAQKVDDHIAQDRIMHTQIDARVSPLEHFRTKAMAYLAFVGVIGTVLIGAAEKALAGLFVHH